MDLSLGGAAIELREWPDEESGGVIGLLRDGERYLIPFDLASSEDVMQGILLHVRFKDVDRRVKVFLRELENKWSAEFRESQRFLAGRPNDVAS